MLSLNYDSKSDVLYIGFSDRSNSYGDEIVDGFVILYDLDTNIVTGVTIFDFLLKYRNNKLNDLPMPVNIDFDKDIISAII
jgi:uncharacterized protein YuzE